MAIHSLTGFISTIERMAPNKQHSKQGKASYSVDIEAGCDFSVCF